VTVNKSPALLSPSDFAAVIEMTPLACIDLLIRNSRNQILLGLRNNEPARGFYFVPGGRILKDELICDAFARILQRETNCIGNFDEARLIGVFEQFYETNFRGETGCSTHCVTLGYELKISDASQPKIDSQHSEHRWWDESDLLASEHVHDDTKAYLR
jgi:colanic acid biosynthesis protein WcaH